MARAKIKPTKVPISERALLQRINRRLKPDLQAVKTVRDVGRRRLDYGFFYRVDYRMNAVLDHHLDLEEMGRDLGVLKPWEEVMS